MGLQRYLFPLLMLWFSFYSCYSSLREDPLSHHHDENSRYDNPAYPAYFGTIDDDEFGPRFTRTRLLNYKPEFYDAEKLNKVGSSPSISPKVVNVDDFGAKGDESDATEAFEKAWKEACSSSGAVLVVPENNNYVLKPITFSGPCKSDLTMKIYGTIEASTDQSDYKKDQRFWLVFDSVQNLLVEGGGAINGNGAIWWKNSCKINKSLPCKHAPTAVTFNDCNNLRVKNLHIKDAQQMHLTFRKCVNVQASNLMVTAPGNSPNTDGIHVTGTQNIQIMNCAIKTGDDCISIVNGSQNVQAMDITCGPGHGISIGSLGAGKSEAHVSNVLVDGATFSGSTNGVRIKTWQGGSGSAKTIKFQNVAMHNVTNPIIIDQNYCDQDGPCKEQDSAVRVSDVEYSNIKGTSASEVAIKFDCSKNFPCRGIVLQNINLVSEGDGSIEASCKNVEWTRKGEVSPLCS